MFSVVLYWALGVLGWVPCVLHASNTWGRTWGMKLFRAAWIDLIQAQPWVWKPASNLLPWSEPNWLSFQLTQGTSSSVSKETSAFYRVADNFSRCMWDLGHGSRLLFYKVRKAKSCLFWHFTMYTDWIESHKNGHILTLWVFSKTALCWSLWICLFTQSYESVYRTPSYLSK